MSKPTIRAYGEHAVLIEWEAVIQTEINDLVIFTTAYIQKNHQEYIIETVPSYCSILVCLKDDVNTDLYIDILTYFNMSFIDSSLHSNSWRIPVCYDQQFGLDLESMANVSSINSESIIQLHTEPIYRIYSMGFLPGFLYLGGLNEQIFFPRKRVINRMAPKGSVAIGGSQTGIYPQESPGGWNIIGRTPIDLFNSKTAKPSPFKTGDSLQFYAINIHQFKEIQEKVSIGSFQLTPNSND